MLLDIEINKLYNYDFYGCKDKKEKLLKSLKSLDLELESFGVFNLIDQKISSFNIQDKNIQNIQNINKFNIDDVLIESNIWLHSQLNSLFHSRYSRQSRYLFKDGSMTPELPAHYKFDQLIAANFGYKSDNSLFVPIWSNTIRISKNTAELVYFPSPEQTKTLLSLNINNYIVKNIHVQDIFDVLVDKLPAFRSS